jgi:hypothetical protein
MFLNPVENIQYILIFFIAIFAGLNAKALGISVVTALGVLHATQIEQYSVVMLAWFVGYMLCNFRD